MEQTLGETNRVTWLVLLLTAIAACLITGLLLAMWMRERKWEIAVFRSMGIPVGSILTQMFLEISGIYITALGISFFALKLSLSAVLGRIDLLPEEYALSITYRDFTLISSTGIIILLLLICIIILPYFTKRPKEILSEMGE